MVPFDNYTNKKLTDFSLPDFNENVKCQVNVVIDPTGRALKQLRRERPEVAKIQAQSLNNAKVLGGERRGKSEQIMEQQRGLTNPPVTEGTLLLLDW